MVEKYNKSIKVIFFDIGGVLLHIHPEKMIKQISTITDIPFDTVKRSFPEGAHDTYERGQMTDNGWFQSCKNSLPTDILIRLKKSYKIWLLSNTNSRHIKKEIENNYVFPKLVDGAIYSYDVGHRKPEQKIYQVACERAEIEPERCVFIDDLKDNISGAINSGLNSIHYNNTTQLKKDLKIMSLIND